MITVTSSKSLYFQTGSVPPFEAQTSQKPAPYPVWMTGDHRRGDRAGGAKPVNLCHICYCFNYQCSNLRLIGTQYSSVYLRLWFAWEHGFKQPSEL